MYPFETKGDFAGIHRGFVNAGGSLIYALRCLLVAPLCIRQLRRYTGQALPITIVLSLYATPLFTWAINAFHKADRALLTTLEAYAAGPQLVQAIVFD